MNKTCVRAVVVASTLLAAQLAEATPPEIHARGGLVTSRFFVFGNTVGGGGSGFAQLEGSGKFGFAVGLSGSLPVGDRGAIRLGATYVAKVGTLAFNVHSGDPLEFGLRSLVIDTTIGYLELPLTFRYVFPIDNARPYAFAGASLALRLHASSADRAVLDAIGADALSDLVRSTATNAIVGAGLDFATSPWGFEIMASFGLTDVFASRTDSGRAQVGQTKLNAFLFLVGYRF